MVLTPCTLPLTTSILVPFCRTPDLSAKSSIIAPPQPTPRSRRSERRSSSSQASEYAPSPTSAELLLSGQLYYNVHIASAPNLTIKTAYSNMHVNIAKAVTGWKPHDDFLHYSDALILATASMTCLELHIRCTRLRYLARFCIVGPDYLHALVEVTSNNNDSWYSLIIGDVKWLALNCDCIPDSGNLADILAYVADYPSRWKSLIARTHRMISLWTRVNCLAADNVKKINIRLDDLGVDTIVEPPPAPAPDRFGYVCPDCGKSFNSRAKVVARRSSFHGWRSIAHGFLHEHSKCLYCLRLLYTRKRLMRHFLYPGNSQCIKDLVHFYQPFHRGPDIIRTKKQHKSDTTWTTGTAAGAPPDDFMKMRVERGHGPVLQIPPHALDVPDEFIPATVLPENIAPPELWFGHEVVQPVDQHENEETQKAHSDKLFVSIFTRVTGILHLYAGFRRPGGVSDFVNTFNGLNGILDMRHPS